jgi:hypothetical protein
LPLTKYPKFSVSISKAVILGIAIGGLVILLIILVIACWPHSPPAVKDVSVSKAGDTSDTSPYQF